MLTPLLESAILQGKAVLKSFVFGASQLGVIDAPGNKMIIITDFFYFPVIPLKSVELREDGVDYFLSSLQFSSKKGIYNYTYKTLYEEIYRANNQTGQQINTYQIHNERVYIRILCFPKTDIWTNVKGDIDSFFNEAEAPLGFSGSGGGWNIIEKIGMPPAFEYYPQNLNMETIGGGSRKVSQFVPTVEKVNTPDLDTTAFEPIDKSIYLPVLNLHYVELDKDFSSTLQGTR